jgi:WD40 repeat protein/tRNA A-37 threonylcarbamoyl transferase component Bud32
MRPGATGNGGVEIPGHDVLEELARGGMGIVYRARQHETARTVALKTLLPQQLGAPEMRQRFRLEARAIARLEHPSILPVYQVGEHDGMPFFTMKLASGGSLAERQKQFRGRFRGVAELMATLADAVQFAHDRGVLHRDLKPGNILFDEAGRPYVSDFGLAKFTQDLDPATPALTLSLSMLGTPQYLAPEIATGGPRAATTAADLYSLGAILYELLAGQPPFEGPSLSALLKNIAEQTPVAPSRRLATATSGTGGDPCAALDGERAADNGGTPVARAQRPPRDLEIICLKCLAKEPARRYPSARAFAEDLRRWLEGRPILARQTTLWERVSAWATRNPALAAVSAALVLFLLGGGGALWHSNRQLRAALENSREARADAEARLRESSLAQARALGAARSTGQRWQSLQALARAARLGPSLELRNEAAAALARPDLREVARFPATFGEAGSAVVFTSDLGGYIAPEPAGGFSLRRTADQRLLASFPGTQGKPARWFVLTPDDRRIAALLDDYSLEVWDLRAHERLLTWQGSIQQPPVAEFHPDGNSAAGYVPADGLFLQRLDGTERRLLQSTNGRAIFLRFDPTGSRLAVARDPGGVEMWRCAAPPSLLWTQPMRRTVPWLAWSPDGRRLVAAADDGHGLRVFSSDTGQTELVYSRHLLYPRQFEFEPAGRTIASVGDDWVLRIWDARTGQDLVTAAGRHRVMRFSRDGRQLTTAPSDHELAVLERAPERVFHEFSSSPSEFLSNRLVPSPDGRLLMVCHPQIRLYNILAGAEAAVLAGPPLPADKQAFFESDGSALFYSCLGKGIYRRALACATNAQDGRLTVHFGEEQLVAPHPNGLIWNAVQSGQTWVRQGDDGIDLWPHRDPRQARHIDARGPLTGVTVSENARWAAAADSTGDRVTVWDFTGGEGPIHLPAHSPQRLWFSPDSRWLVASVESGYTTWDTTTWKPGAAWEARLDSGNPGEIAFNHDGRLVAARQERETFRLLSFPEGREWITLKPPLVVSVRDACLSADGTRLWLLAGNCRIFEWNLAELRTQLAQLSLDWR